VAERGREVALVGSVCLAFSLWFLLFSPLTALTRTIHNSYFWFGMSGATAILGGGTLILRRREVRRLLRFEVRLVGVGLLHAVGLYALSRLGVFLLSLLFPSVLPQIGAVYATRAQLAPAVVALLLGLLIAPLEEVFWRGWVLDRLLHKMPPVVALAIAVALYGGAHVWAANPMLILAALVVGAHWAYLFWRFGSLVPGLVSHAAWDVAIFVLFPVRIR